MSWLNHLTKFSNETYKHFMAKACMFYILRKMKHELRTEHQIGSGYVDILDITTQTIYEIELSASKKFRERKYEQYKMTCCEIIIVDCSKMPVDFEGMKKYLEEFVVPD